MRKKLTNNLALKLLSLLIAVLLWFIVLNIYDPVQSFPYTDIQVKLVNNNLIDNSADSIYNIEENSDVVTVTVVARKSLLDKLKADDFEVKADFTEMNEWENDYYLIPLTVECASDDIDDDSVKVSPQNLKIKVEERLEQEFVIKGTADDTTPATGYDVGTIEPNPVKLSISGPRSIVEKIDEVKAPINVEGRRKDVLDKEVTLKIFDNDGEELSAKDMEKLTFSTDNNQPVVEVSAYIWKVQEVKLKVNILGEPANDYIRGEEVITPDTINVSGPAEALEALEEQGNVVELDDILVQGMNDDVTKEFSDDDIKDILTSLGLRWHGDDEAGTKVVVTVPIEKMGEKEISVSPGNIDLSGQKIGFGYDIKTKSSVKVILQGQADEVSEIKAEDLKFKLDVSELASEGTYEVVLEAEGLPEGIAVKSEVKVEIEITRDT